VRAALVTGTSSGIGEACVRRLAAGSWTVYAGVRRPEDGERLAGVGGDVRPLILDVSDTEQVDAAVDRLQTDTGDQGLAGLVNNAGIGVGGPVEYLSDEDWQRVFDVNLFAPVRLSRLAMPLLRAGHGRIVYIGSVGGRLAAPGLGPYAASKHALEAVAEAQRQELRRAGGLFVSLVEPGEVKTAIWDKAQGELAALDQMRDEQGHERYGWLLEQSKGFLDEGRRQGVDADRVARAVEHALTARTPKRRYLVGPDAKISGHVISKTPDRVRDALVRTNGRRWETRARKLPADAPAQAYTDTDRP